MDISQKRLRVLVVDDETDTAGSFRLILDVWGYDVRVAAIGPDAIFLASDYHPAIVFLDLGIPGLNGCEVARALAGLPHRPFIVVVSDFGTQEDRNRSADAGANLHLLKPPDLDVVKKLLEIMSRVTATIGN